MDVIGNEGSATLRRAYDYVIQEHDEKIILTKSAGECLFDGYFYPLFNGTRFKIPAKDQYFGWFLGQNGSIDFVSYSDDSIEINSNYSFQTHEKSYLNYETNWNR